MEVAYNVQNTVDTGLPNDPTITPLNLFPLPVSLTNLKAARKGTSIEVAWNEVSESGMVKYEIEKSTNGRNFVKIGEAAALNRNTVTPYSFLDQNPSAGANYYRLRVIDGNSTTKYSLIVRVDMDGRNNDIKIYPNPVVAQSITLQLSNMQKGTYELLFCSNIGQVAYRKTVYHDGGSFSRTISLPKTFVSGTYFVQLRTDKLEFSQLMLVK